MHKISSNQCRTARGLLKWNVLDLVNQVKSVSSHRIEDFEKNAIALVPWENDEVVAIFKKHGIEFGSERVSLQDPKQKRRESDIMQQPTKPPGKR